MLKINIYIGINAHVTIVTTDDGRTTECEDRAILKQNSQYYDRNTGSLGPNFLPTDPWPALGFVPYGTQRRHLQKKVFLGS